MYKYFMTEKLERAKLMVQAMNLEFDNLQKEVNKIQEVDVENKDLSSLLQFVVDYQDKEGYHPFDVKFEVPRSADKEEFEYAVCIWNNHCDIDLNAEPEPSEEERRQLYRTGYGYSLFDALYNAAKEWKLI